MLDRTLYFRGMVVKHFDRAAPNMELILAAFEEQGWSRIIDALGHYAADDNHPNIALACASALAWPIWSGFRLSSPTSS
jgi:hypothetical protein